MSKMNRMSRMNPNFQAVSVVYNSDINFRAMSGVGLQGARAYTYLAPSHMNLKVDDRVVIVVGGSAVKVATVVDTEAEIDWSAPWDYKWVVQKIDQTPYKEHIEALTAYAKMDSPPDSRELSPYEKGDADAS